MRPHSHVHIFKQLPDHNDLVLSDQNQAGSSPVAGIPTLTKLAKEECFFMFLGNTYRKAFAIFASDQ